MITTNKGLKIITLDATDLLMVDKGKVVPNNLSQFYEFKDKETGETLTARKKNLFLCGFDFQINAFVLIEAR